MIKNNNKKFNDLIEKKKILIASHRGVSGGSIIENTMDSFNIALASGADIVELDVVRSKDGVYYVYHDTEELRTLGFSNNLHSSTSNEIENLRYINRYGFRTTRKIDKFVDVLEKLKGKCLINLDRCYKAGFDYLKGALDIIASLDMLDQVLVKTTVREDLLKGIEEYYPNILFMPIVSNVSQIEFCEKFKINMVALEIIFKTDEDEIINEKNIKKYKNKGYELWVNTICIDENYVMSGGYDDNLALNQDMDLAWGWLMEKGFSIIQTDWPYFLEKYLKERLSK